MFEHVASEEIVMALKDCEEEEVCSVILKCSYVY